MRTMILGLVAVLMSGCSLATVRAPPPDYKPPAPLNCTSATGPVVADAVIGVVLALAGAGYFVAAAQGIEPKQGYPGPLVLGLGFSGAAVPFLVSAGIGTSRTRRCDAAERDARIAAAAESSTRLAAAQQRAEGIEAERSARHEAAEAEIWKRAAETTERERLRHEARVKAAQAEAVEQQRLRDEQRLAAVAAWNTLVGLPADPIPEGVQVPQQFLASALFDAWDTNEVRATEQYLWKQVQVVGRVGKVFAGDQPYVSIGTSGTKGSYSAGALFCDVDEETAKTLDPRAPIAAEGTLVMSDGILAKYAWRLRNCGLLSKPEVALKRLCAKTPRASECR